jgi:hypothetical protein
MQFPHPADNFCQVKFTSAPCSKKNHHSALFILGGGIKFQTHYNSVKITTDPGENSSRRRYEDNVNNPTPSAELAKNAEKIYAIYV